MKNEPRFKGLWQWGPWSNPWVSKLVQAGSGLPKPCSPQRRWDPQYPICSYWLAMEDNSWGRAFQRAEVDQREQRTGKGMIRRVQPRNSLLHPGRGHHNVLASGLHHHQGCVLCASHSFLSKWACVSLYLILAQRFIWHMNGAETAACPFKSEVDGQWGKPSILMGKVPIPPRNPEVLAECNDCKGHWVVSSGEGTSVSSGWEKGLGE